MEGKTEEILHGYVTNADFLTALNNDRNKVIYVKITVLDAAEQPLRDIEGRVSTGSISVNGSSAVRRTCNITFVAEEADNNLTDIDNLLSINKKIRILVGLQNNVDSRYSDIIWFPQGIFVICQPSISHTTSGVTISLSCKDKMCLLNGECGGNLPTSITFHEYDQTLEDGSVVTMPQLVYDIIQTLVCRWGGESISNIMINDIPLRLKQVVRYIGNDVLYLNTKTGYYTTNYDLVKYFKEQNKQKYVDALTIGTQVFINSFSNGTETFTDFTKINNGPAYCAYGLDSNNRGYIFLCSKVSAASTFYTYKDNLGNLHTINNYKKYIDNDNITWYYTVLDNNSPSLNMLTKDDKGNSKITMVCVSADDSGVKKFDGVFAKNDTDLKAVLNHCFAVHNDGSEDGIIKTDGVWKHFVFNEEVGYQYVDFTYPGELISNIGDSVCSVLDNIIQTLGNYEYFYDVNGTFIFQEKRNYLNTTYDITDPSFLSNNARIISSDSKDFLDLSSNDLKILNEENCKISYVNKDKSVYNFSEGSGLVSSFTNNPNYSNIKNDYHIWGKNGDNTAIHYHFVIKDKPKKPYPPHNVKFLKDDAGRYTGQVVLKTVRSTTGENAITEENGVLKIPSTRGFSVSNGTLSVDGVENPRVESTNVLSNGLYIDETDPDAVYGYVANDWRAEVYLQALEKQANQIRPDIYEQEILDNFDSIYNFYTPVEWKGENITKYGAFKTDMVSRPNDLNYFIDYLEPADSLYDYSVDNINPKIYSYQQDNVKRLYDMEVPNYILVDYTAENKNQLIEEAQSNGDIVSQIDDTIASVLAASTSGYSAQEVARDLLYQYTNYNESISLSIVPIYYLEPNTRITVQDKSSNIFGDYIIDSISIPLDCTSMMSISAKRAQDRI